MVKRILKIKIWLLGLLMLSCVHSLRAPERSAEHPDFKGKTVKLIVGTATGGGVDLYAA